jgi:ribosome-binding protein aMBF1 (putative translation factor)
MLENEESLEQRTEKKKKGRKPTQKKYFDEPEENAVREFLITDSIEEKNKIYNEFLKHPLDKMISSIIRRYKLYRKDMNFEEVHIDTHSFLMTKIDKFKPSKEKKAYSYFGTICKNYLMGQIMKDQKETNRKISYEDISSDLQHSPDMIYHIDDYSITTEEIIKRFLDKLLDTLNDKQMSEQEVKLGQALYDMFENYNNIFLDTSNNKFNKNIILFELREMTNLTTKEIRSSIKRYRKIYFQLIQEMVK